MSPKKEFKKSRVNNSALYFSQKINPGIDASKRREFLRGLNEYITKKCIKGGRKGYGLRMTPQKSPVKSKSPRVLIQS